MGKICTDHLDAVCPGRGCYIAGGLMGRFRVNFNSYEMGLGCPLCNLQCNHSASSTYVEHTLHSFNGSPSAKQHAIGTYLHGAAVVPHGELLESKMIFSHKNLWSK